MLNVRKSAVAISICLAGLTFTQPRILSQEVSLHDDGGWCWFEDERALICNGKLVFGVVAMGRSDPTRKGNIEVVSYELDSGQTHESVLHHQLSADDHNSPALVELGDGRLLAMYCKHGEENSLYYRISQHPGDTTDWQAEQTFVPSESSRVTYSNLFRLAVENRGRGRIYNFYRGFDDTFKPSWMFSDDDGRTWENGGRFIDFLVPQRHRPYVKYASNGKDTVHFIFTEGHPRDFDNSLYHAYFRDGVFFRTDGSKIKDIDDGPITPTEATRIFSGDENNVAWPSDLHLDVNGNPVAVYSVQRDSAGLPRGQGGNDHRYRYACWDGQRWIDHQVAFAGQRLYSGEDDYTGLICIDPNAPQTVYFSSDVDVSSGEPAKNGRFEMYRGKTNDQGRSWTFTSLTRNSKVDNIRPIVPHSDGKGTAVLWLRGELRSYTDYDLEVLGIIE